MAFNPFHGFRKHQKAIFAVLVIICMFVFILQSGMAGDAVQRMLALFGAGKGKGKEVATLHGTKVYEIDLQRLMKQREMAARLVLFAAAQADRSPENRILTLADKVSGFAQFGHPPFGPFGRNEDLLDFIIWKHVADQLGIVLTEADVEKAVERVAGKKVFGGKSFTSSRLVEELLKATRKNNMQTMTDKELLAALTDEFRVLVAKEAVLGHGPGAFGENQELEELIGQFTRKFSITQRPDADVPAVTPLEFLQFYRDQRAELRVWMLPVKVEDYLAEARKTKPVPSDKILEDLFQQYKSVEPSPDRDRPAFKEPARVKAAWVSAGTDLPYFKEQARLRVELPEAYTKLDPKAAVKASIAAQVGNMAAVFTAPGASTPFLNLAAVPYTFDRTLPRYADYQQRERAAMLMTFDGKFALHDRSLTHPAPLGFVLGNALAAAANPVTGPAALPAVTTSWFGPAALYEASETRRVLEAQVAMLGTALFPPLGGGINLNPLGGAAYASPLRYGLPLDKDGRPKLLYNDYWQVRDRLREEIRNDEVAAVVDAEMAALSKDIAASKGNAEEAEKKVKEAVKKFGLHTGSMPTALDRFDLEKDESLKKVREDFLDSRRAGSPSAFSDFLLRELTAPYEPKEFRRFKGDTYLAWQTEMVKAREPRSLAEVKDKVIDAWYLREARTLARKQAEQWSMMARKAKGKEKLDDVERDLRKEGKNDGFTLRKVARLTDEAALAAAGGRTYRPYTVDTSKIEYPRPNLVDQLVKQLKEPGDSMVVSDRPERNFYVAVLENRDDKDSREAIDHFVKEVYEKTPRDDRFWTEFLLPSKRRDYEKLVMRQLREDAGAPLKDGEYDLPADINSPRTDTGGGGEGD
jgi:hypothetical protein